MGTYGMPKGRMVWVLCALNVLMVRPVWSADDKSAVVAEDKKSSETTERSPVPDGINADFLNPELDPTEWTKRFEIESREVFAGRASILRALNLQAGHRIADVGSGTGMYLGPFSKAVGGDGQVYAVDISPRLIDFIQRRIRAEDLHNVKVIQSSETSVLMDPESVDRIFVCDTYHHFEFHVAMLKSMRSALKPGGELVIIDFDRVPGKSREWLLTHVRAGKDVVRGEISNAGFEFVEEVSIPEFHENYFLRFRKPQASAKAAGP